MADWVDVAPAAEFPPGKVRLVDVDDVLIAVFNIDGAYHAIEDLCSHEDADLSTGCLEGEEIVCPRHGARFSVITGEALTPPAYEPVQTFPTRVENGVVQVIDDRWD